ncbi:hypothetical protein BR93DRAFT_958159 [Coniochaeta sp. PMI_546]|nr:hypothetical protein BR93DRAFT_958159 [Coniochaeta sp. PMI_546]
MSGSRIPATPPTGMRMAPAMPLTNNTITSMGTTLSRVRIFSDLNARNFRDSHSDPNTIDPAVGSGTIPGVYVHLGNISPYAHKLALEAKYGIATTYVDELQLKWQQLKAGVARHHAIPNPASVGTDAEFDSFDPDPRVWNDFYIDRRDAVMSEIFAKSFHDKTACIYLLNTFLSFHRASQENRRLSPDDFLATQTLELLTENRELAHSPDIFAYLEILVQASPSPELAGSADLGPEELQARKAVLARIGDAYLNFLHSYKYVSQVFVVWLQTLIRNGKPSPCSGKAYLTTAATMVAALEEFPSFLPAESFVSRLETYTARLSGLSDWIRIKLSREDYLVRLQYTHLVVLEPLPEDFPKLGGQIILNTPSVKDPFAQVLCVVWAGLGIKPQLWMMHFSNSEEEIRKEAQHRALKESRPGGLVPIAGDASNEGESSTAGSNHDDQSQV